MRTRWYWWLAIPALLVGCDLSSEQERRAMMSEVAKAEVASLAAEREALASKVDEQRGRIEVLETQHASLSAEVVSLEAEVAEIEATLEKLEKENAGPTPVVRAGRPDPSAYYKVEVGDAQVRGPETALVTIVTWSDFQCPFCNRVTGTIDTLRKDYGDDLRYVFKHNPLAFHTNARAAAIAAEAAGEQGKFWEMHDKLFENQRDLDRKHFIAWARALGLDVKRFERDLDRPELADRVDAQQREGVTLGARGTPTFFVNGRFLSGAQPVPAFKRLIDEEKAKAEAKVAAGTSRARVYGETIGAGRTAP